jgi:hypothetical protein
VVEVRVGDEKPAKAVLVPETTADVAEIEWTHEGDSGVEEGRGFGCYEVGRQVDIRKGIETLDDFPGFFDDHGLYLPSKRPGV